MGSGNSNGSDQTAVPESSAARVDKMLERRTVWKFRRVKNRALHTLEGKDFRKLIDDSDKWDRLVAQMNAYFNHSIELFPYTAPGQSNNARVKCPRRFHQIERDEIEKAFSGGLVPGEPGDADLRGLLAGLQRCFTYNLSLYYIIKRVIEAAVVGWFIVMFMMFRNGVSVLPWVACNILNKEAGCLAASQPTMNGLTEALFVGVIAIILFIHFRVNASLHFCLESTLDSSCLLVDRETALRTKNLTNLIDDIVPHFSDDQYELRSVGREKEWPQRSRKWAILIYWLAQRLEYIERYVQIEIWLVRRWHYWLQLSARLSFYAIVVAFFVLIFLTGYQTFAPVLAGKTQMSVWVPIGYVVALAAGSWTLHASYFRWNTPLTLIEEKLRPDNWKRYSDVHLQEKFADQIARDQSEILKNEEHLGGRQH